MRELWWFIHIFGISLWFGVTTAGLIAWPSRRALSDVSSLSASFVKVQTLVGILTKSSHIGAGLTALGGAALSFLVQPKSDLGSLWLTSMQGVGVAAFVISTFVMTRKGKRLLKYMKHESAGEGVPEDQAAEANSLGVAEPFLAAAEGYRKWLLSAFVLLVFCLFMAAFKFTLH